MEYIEKRNVPHSRDKLPLSCIKIIRYSEYPEYQAKVEAEGFVAHYRGNKIAVGLRAEVEKVIRALFPKTVNTKHLSVARASAVDLWWIQNRYDEMRKVAS